MKVSIWRKLASPWYLAGSGPWAALAGLALYPTLCVAGLSIFVLVAAASSNYTGYSLLAVLTMPLCCIPLLPVFAVWFGHVERGRLWMLGVRDVATSHVHLPVSPLRAWLTTRYREPATWREVLALVIAGIISFFTSLLLVMEGTFHTILGIFWLYTGGMGQRIPIEADDAHPVGRVMRWASSGEFTPEDWWKFPLLILGGMIVFAYVNGLLAAVTASASTVLLSPRPEEIERQVQSLTSSRARIMDAFESERRRIERDLHDGVQQELVNLNLRLGMAAFELQTLEQQGVDAEAPREQITRAQEQLDHALRTLRNTVRGIYPAVLEDHGLRAALEELADNCLLPVRLAYHAADRLPQEVQRSAYYIANEAVTNALKHSTASQLWITVSSRDGVLTIEVTDNGQGGARTEGGTGISGLNERVKTMNGSVRLVSPTGGPTTLFGSMPLDPESAESPSSSRSVSH